jgi:putative ABC transport system permease protein
MLWETLAVALRAIRTNAMRSVLTCLGIIIGIAAVIAVTALGQGAQESVQEQIAAMGTNLLFVRPGQQRQMGVAQGEKPLTIDDADALRRGSTALAAVEPQMSRSFQVEHLDANVSTTVVGTTPEYPQVENYKIALGRFFNASEVEGRRRVAIVGSETVTNLKRTPDQMLDSEIKIGGVQFEVIGVFAAKGQASFFSPDDQIVIPISTARFRLIGGDRLRSITAQVVSPDQIPLAMTEIERVLRRQHRLREGEENDFSIRDQSDLRATFESTTRTFSMLLAGIAAVSLVVGGIGIMNIMMVSVTERTREIGVRKALGATKRGILMQFLTEALTLCLLGGVLGIALGGGTAALMARLAGWRTIVTPESIALAVTFAALVGLFFGIYPAARAAAMDPIEALRYV